MRRICLIGWDMGAFEYRQAEEIRDAFARHDVEYLFLGKSAAILLGHSGHTGLNSIAAGINEQLEEPT